MSKAIAVLSGGMDSTVLAYMLRADGVEIECLSVDYGQRHRRELDYAEATAKRLGVRWHLADLTGVTHLLGGSALTDNIPVSDGHYTDASMRVTVVPNRNAIMLSVAVGLAVSSGADAVAFGAHAGDHPIYPDCRPAFVEAFEVMARQATEGYGVASLRILAPFILQTKADICATGHRLGVPWSSTWSCYKGGEQHCGTCGTCVERREAFALAGVFDPTEYIDDATQGVD